MTRFLNISTLRPGARLHKSDSKNNFRQTQKFFFSSPYKKEKISRRSLWVEKKRQQLTESIIIKRTTTNPKTCIKTARPSRSFLPSHKIHAFVTFAVEFGTHSHYFSLFRGCMICIKWTRQTTILLQCFLCQLTQICKHWYWFILMLNIFKSKLFHC